MVEVERALCLMLGGGGGHGHGREESEAAHRFLQVPTPKSMVLIWVRLVE